MALQFIAGPGQFNESTNRVRFFALDDQQSVMFATTREALEDLAERESLSRAELEETFDRHRERIERCARRMYTGPTMAGGAYVIGPGMVGD